MSRVLLIVQNGEGRPKCVRSAKWSAAYWEHDSEQIFGPSVVPLMGSADLWWLVKCENAEQGRRLIAVHEATGLVMVGDGGVVTCRILASGGRS